MHVDPTVMEHRLEALRGLGRWPAAEVERFGRALESADAWELFRINPLRFAEREGFDPSAAVDLFVHGVKIGLFDLEWSCICVYCGAIEYTYDRVDALPIDRFHCTRCAVDIDVWLDERVEISFSLHRSVAELNVDPFADVHSYARYFSSSSVVHQPHTARFLAEIHAGCILLAAHGDARLELTLPVGASLRLLSYDRHAQLLLSATESRAEARGPIEIDLLATGFATESMTVAAGRVELHLHNRESKPTGVVLLEGDAPSFAHEVEAHRASMGPFLSGQMLMCSESFRRLFHVQTLDAELAINVRHVALLFTDLVASTQLYDQVGDAAAYGLVREHFRELQRATEAHGGAIIKTMGDAVMAAFCSADAAVQCGLEMLARIDALNRRIAAKGRALGLRVGIHAGPSLVVNAQDRLDYFGQVVNVAARVQALAEPGTLCVSAEVYAATHVAEILERDGEVIVVERVAIRGVADSLALYRIRARPA